MSDSADNSQFKGRSVECGVIAIDATGDRDSIQVVYRERSPDRALVGPPVLSPDGKEILFSIQDRVCGGRADQSWNYTYIYLLSADGNSEPRLLEGTKIGRINRRFDWSPDGSNIIFSSERGEKNHGRSVCRLLLQSHNELRSMRRAICRSMDRVLNCSASGVLCYLAESIELTRRPGHPEFIDCPVACYPDCYYHDEQGWAGGRDPVIGSGLKPQGFCKLPELGVLRGSTVSYVGVFTSMTKNVTISLVKRHTDHEATFV